MRSFVAAVAALGAAIPLVAAKVSYDGYKAFHIDSHDDYDAVRSALDGLRHVSLGCEDNHKTFDVAIAPESLKEFEALKLDATVMVEDLGADLAAEATFKPYSSTSKLAGAGDLPDASYFESYHTYEEHEQFLVDLQASFADNSEIFVAGESVEGRALQGIHLWGKDGPGKAAIVWHANVHAREWITSMTVEYMTYKLVQGYQNGSAVPASTLDNYDFYIMPIVNPDGFVYTNDEDRLWRKNRQVRSGKRCTGTDVNRNWPYQWDVPGGSSPDACSETYRGESPGDTPENAALTNHTISLSTSSGGPGIKLFVDWHSFSQLILLPYGYSCSAEADNLDKQMELAGGVAEAIKGVNGLEFVYGPTCETIYAASGGSNDWAYDVAGAELAWAFELRPASGGSNGFVIPPSNIVPSGEENWAGMEYLFSNF